jgi:hypothetical protein
MSFKAINDLISLDSLILTLLVYNIYLQIIEYNSLLLTIL